MRNLRLALGMTLVVGALLLGTTALGHAHDTSAPGLYSSRCALHELGGHVVVPPLAAPSVGRLDITAAPVPSAPDALPLDVVLSAASPRAPPLG